MLSLITALMLPISYQNANIPKDPNTDTEEYARCLRQYPCQHDDNPSLKGLDEHDRKAAMRCRIARHLKCSEPEKEEGLGDECDKIVLDPVCEYYHKKFKQ